MLIECIDSFSKYLNEHVSSFTLLYRASRDGFEADMFHELCDEKGPTLSIIEAENGYKFGGFTRLTWEGNPEEYVFYKINDDSAFIFSLTN